MTGIGFEHPGKGGRGSSARTRAERRAADRRTRAMSHLQRVRRQTPKGRQLRNAVKTAKPIAFAVGALLGAALASGAGWITGDARIATISVSGTQHLAAADVAAASGIPRSAAVAAVDFGVVTERLEQHDWIAEARALRLPTGTLVVGITERRPAGRLLSDASEQSYLVDAAGTPFAIADEGDERPLTQVRIAEPIVPRTAPAGVARALDLADDLRRFEMPRTVEIQVAAADDPAGFALVLDGVAPRIILGRDDFETKLQNLARLLATGPAGLSGATELDLRFAGQAVLRNEPLPEGAAQAAAARGDAPPSI